VAALPLAEYLLWARAVAAAVSALESPYPLRDKYPGSPFFFLTVPLELLEDEEDEEEALVELPDLLRYTVFSVDLPELEPEDASRARMSLLEVPPLLDLK